MKALLLPLALTLPVARSRCADYLELAKLRVAVLVLFTVAVGGWLAGLADGDGLVLLHTVCATGLVAAGASALNQLLERHTDALMHRTEHRPLPSGRLHAVEVLLVGLLLGLGGLAYMAVAVRQPLTLLLTALTFVMYVWCYTPLKRVTAWNTLIGAVPGALPPVIGWTAVRGTVGTEALAVFLVLFFWQLPHFFAIAWIYRADYARAGLRMVSTDDAAGTNTGRQMVGFCVALVLASLLPVWWMNAGVLYGMGAAVLGWLFLRSTLTFARAPSTDQARVVLRVSLLYLPLLLALLLLGSLAGSVALAW
jgi:protoheme IX farnesyltransferase